MRRLILTALLLSTALALTAEASRTEDRSLLRWIRRKPVIDSIVIEGNNYFTDSQIKDQMYSRTVNLWRRIKGDRRYRVQRESYQRDTLEIKFLYLKNGFLDINVKENPEVLGEDSTALVRVTIEEGRYFRIGPIALQGELDFPTDYSCRKIIKRFKHGQPINHFDMQQAIFDMKSYLANNGHPYAKVRYSYDDQVWPDPVPIVFHVSPNSLVHYGSTTIEGAENFPEYVGARELVFTEGEIYKRSDIIRSQRRLFESGYYRSFSLKRDPNSSDSLNPDFKLVVRERKTRNLTFRTGAAQSEVSDLQWDVSGGFAKRNLFGSRRYEIGVAYSFALGSNSRLISNVYRIRFTEPWPVEIRMPLSVTFDYEPELQDPTNDFDKESYSVAASTHKRFGRKIQAILGFEFQHVNITGVPKDQIASLRELTDNQQRRVIFANFKRDSRDNIFIPLRGVNLDMSAELFGGFLGGDNDFFIIHGSWSRFEKIWPGWVMATRLKGSWSDAFNETEEVPLDEAIYLGGANTVRSFNYNELGRFEDPTGSPLASRFTLVLNQEFRWKTVQILNKFPFIGGLMKSIPLWQSIFFDMGNGFREKKDISFNRMAFAYGSGVQFVTPAGPIRIDYARRVKTEDYGFADAWHFTILYAF